MDLWSVHKSHFSPMDVDLSYAFRFSLTLLRACLQTPIGVMLPLPSEEHPSKFSATQIATGGTCVVFACEPMSGARDPRQFIAVKQLYKREGAEKLLENECVVMQRLRSVKEVQDFIPNFLFQRSSPLEIGMQPIGEAMLRHDLTPHLITSLIDYAVGLNNTGLADWDLRDVNIMLVR